MMSHMDDFLGGGGLGGNHQHVCPATSNYMQRARWCATYLHANLNSGTVYLQGPATSELLIQQHSEVAA